METPNVDTFGKRDAQTRGVEDMGQTKCLNFREFTVGGSTVHKCHTFSSIKDIGEAYLLDNHYQFLSFMHIV